MAEDRETLHEESWSWALEQMPEGLLLTVLCGTVGVYEKSILLDPGEVRLWQETGPAGLESLVEAIRFDPSSAKFAARYRPDLGPGGSDR